MAHPKIPHLKTEKYKAIGKRPYGFDSYRDEEGQAWFVPHKETIEFLAEAIEHIRSGRSVRTVAAWLEDKTKRKLSATRLHKLAWTEEELAERRKDRRKKLTPKQRKIEDLKNTEKQTRIKAEQAKRRLERARTGSGIQTGSEPESFSDAGQPLERDVAFRPNPGPQTDFLAANEREVFYGGARGGGKTYSLLIAPLRFVDKSTSRALLIRRSMPELRDVIFQTQQLYPKAVPGAKFKTQENTWHFPGGARIEFGYCENLQDVLRYQGQSYSWIGVDELPQYDSPDVWHFLRSSLRSADPSIPLHMRACVDEGEVLTVDGWKDIKDVRFGETVYSMDLETGELITKPVTGSYVYDIDEPLVRIFKKGFYASMTKDHRIAYRRHNVEDKIEISRWNEYKGKSINLIRASNGYNAPGFTKPDFWEGSVEDYCEFLGLFIAEGCTTTRNRVIITQSKEQNHDFVRRVMGSSGLKVYYSCGDFTISDTALREHLLPLGKAHQKHFPREFLKTATKQQLELAFKAYALGDGHWQSENSVECYTTSEQLRDDLQEIAFKIGARTHTRKRVYPDPNQRDSWTVAFVFNKKHTKVDRNPNKRNDVVEVDYKGKVYCISVQDTENFILRQKGVVYLSGNTGNPGNRGSRWVKELFIEPCKPNTRFSEKVEYELEGRTLSTEITRKFIPASVWDNPYLTQDSSYIAMLASLPEVKRKQFLYGDWDVVEDGAFSEFSRSTHVVEPFEVPNGWTRIRAADFGFSSPSAILWGAVDYDNNIWIYRELYVSKVTADQLGRMIREVESGDGKIYDAVLDSSCWARRGDRGPSIAEMLNAEGCRFRPSDRSPGSRISGKIEVHKRLMVDEDTEEPRLRIFENCPNLIRQLSSLPLDKNNPEDVDTKAEDHAYDALRYMVSSRPTNIRTAFENMPKSTWRPSDNRFGY